MNNLKRNRQAARRTRIAEAETIIKSKRAPFSARVCRDISS